MLRRKKLAVRVFWGGVTIFLLGLVWSLELTLFGLPLPVLGALAMLPGVVIADIAILWLRQDLDKERKAVWISAISLGTFFLGLTVAIDGVLLWDELKFIGIVVMCIGAANGGAAGLWWLIEQRQR